jgi:hypothetical protein
MHLKLNGLISEIVEWCRLKEGRLISWNWRRDFCYFNKKQEMALADERA